MPATVPLTSPVTSIAGARALAESASLADPTEPVGPAIDRIVLFLHSLARPALVRETAGILDVMDLLSEPRAERATAWLAGHAEDAAESAYWSTLRERVTLPMAA